MQQACSKQGCYKSATGLLQVVRFCVCKHPKAREPRNRGLCTNTWPRLFCRNFSTAIFNVLSRIVSMDPSTRLAPDFISTDVMKCREIKSFTTRRSVEKFFVFFSAIFKVKHRLRESDSACQSWGHTTLNVEDISYVLNDVSRFFSFYNYCEIIRSDKIYCISDKHRTVRNQLNRIFWPNRILIMLDITLRYKRQPI